MAQDVQDVAGDVREGGPEDAGRRLRASLEAVLMVADEPVRAESLARATGESADEVDLLLRELAGEYAEQGRGFELRETATGWRVYSRPEHAEVVEAFLLDGQTAKLTQAALETLAIVAYRQPVSRSRVAAVRGVSVDGVVRTLLSRGLVREVGVEATSGATLYGTTEEFLQRMGLDSLDDLPALAPFLPEEVGPEDLDPPEVLAPPTAPPAVRPPDEGVAAMGEDGHPAGAAAAPGAEGRRAPADPGTPRPEEDR